MPYQITTKKFTDLARATAKSLETLGVALPKGHYCHILEATARGLGFSSKSSLDILFNRGEKSVSLPESPNEDAAREWLLGTGITGPIPPNFLLTPFRALFPIVNPIQTRTSNMAKPTNTKAPIPSPALAPLAQATSNIVAQYASRVWSTADTLRGVGAKASEWPNHMMPFFALMLLESRALRAREEALASFGGQFDPSDPQDVIDLKAAYVSAGGASGQTYHQDLVLYGQGLAHVVSGGPAGFSQRLRAYLNGYDDTTRRWLGVNPSVSGKAYLNIEGTVRFLEGKGGENLWRYCNSWAQVDLVGYDSSAVTTLEEHIKRSWADLSSDTAGEHYTPADLIDLVSAIALDHFKRHPLKGNFLRVYDPTCGGGNMLFGVEDDLRAADAAGLLLNASGERYSIQSFGQELNDTLFSLAAIEGRFRPAATIKEGNTLSDDQFPGEKFHLIVANPPYGTDWKQIQSEINADQTGRFPDNCRPPVSDGQHLFLQHIYHHLADDGLALVFCSGSTLFSGDAGGGESNARSKYILTDDGVWGLIQLPKNEFFNTGINTYVWVFKKCKPGTMSERVFLLNAEGLFSKMRKSLGNKNSEITERDRKKIVSLIAAAEDPTTANTLMEDGAALTVDIANRIDPDNCDTTTILEGGGIHLKVIQIKDATLEEPALLRLFDGEQLHYNKVALELTRGGEYGEYTKEQNLNDIRVYGSTDDEMNQGKGVLIGTTGTGEEEFLNNVSENAASVGMDPAEFLIKDAQKWVRMVLDRSLWVAIQSNSDQNPGSSLYRWNTETRILFDANGKPLGRSKLDIKLKWGGKRGEPTKKLLPVVTIGPDTEKDTETTPYSRDPETNMALIDAFLARWVRDPYEIVGDPAVGCEINFNRLFPKTAERKSLAQVNQELAEIDEQIAALNKEGA